MGSGRFFLSHAKVDLADANALKGALEAAGVSVFVDHEQLRPGDDLNTLDDEIRKSRGVVVLVTPAAMESDWVKRELGVALATRRVKPAYRVVFVVKGVPVAATRFLVDGEDLLAIEVTGFVRDVAPRVLVGLKVLAPGEQQSKPVPPAPDVHELVFSFSRLTRRLKDGEIRVRGDVQLERTLADGREDMGRRHVFESPLGPVEQAELSWYLGTWSTWPAGPGSKRACKVEDSLVEWGRSLLGAVLQADEDARMWRDWIGVRGNRRVVIKVSGSGAGVLELPWELLADERGFVFAGRKRARVIRRLERAEVELEDDTGDVAHVALRVLLVVSRPDDGWIDPRVSLTPVLEALGKLGDRVDIELLEPASLVALGETLNRAEERGKPFDVVHFDGHGVYRPDLGCRALVFVAHGSADKDSRMSELVPAAKLGELLAEHRVPLVLLEARRSARSTEDLTGSVAAELVKRGVGNVVAMSHSVLVETARRFVDRFYAAPVEGRRPGTAVLAGQVYLRNDLRRHEVTLSDGSHGVFELHDWMVPVLYQARDADQPLIPGDRGLPDPDAVERTRDVALGRDPEDPRRRGVPGLAHGFVGRGRMLMVLFRRLSRRRPLLLVGAGGVGKTAVAAELCRWLVAARRFSRAIWVSVEHDGKVESVVFQLGVQLDPAFSGGEVELRGLLKRLEPVLLVVDNVESAVAAGEILELGALLARLGRVGGTRVVLTSREVPEELVERLSASVLRVDRLSAREGRQLVRRVLEWRGERLPEDRGMDELVEATGGHARSLVLLAGLVARDGAVVTQEALVRRMRELDREGAGREKSLLASVRLSADRLTVEERRMAAALGVFHGAADYTVLAKVAGMTEEESQTLGRRLVEVGLASTSGAFLVFEPAVVEVLGEGLQDREVAQERWLQHTLRLVWRLYQQMFKDIRLAYEGVRVARPEVEALVDQVGKMELDQAQKVLHRLDELLRDLGPSRLRDRVAQERARIEEKLEDVEWTHAAFLKFAGEYRRLMREGRTAAAIPLCREALSRAVAVGDAFPNAEYGRAMIRKVLGTALLRSGAAEEAILALEVAKAAFEGLPGELPARMASVCVAERADAYCDLGRLDDAVESYLENIQRAENLGDLRQAAVGRGQLGSVRLLQRRYGDALEAHRAARATFQQLGEDPAVATAWHEEGRVHHGDGNFAAAEVAWRRSLEIKTRLGNATGRAATLGLLGNLFDQQGRLDDAVAQFQEAGPLFEHAGDSYSAGQTYSNMARTLHSLGRLEDACEAIHKAIRCKQRFGHAAEPWKTWAIFAKIETSAGNPTGAAEARRQAITTYAAYRRDGGEPMTGPTRLIATVAAALARGESPSLPGLARIGHSAPIGSGERGSSKSAVVRGLDLLDSSMDRALDCSNSRSR